MTIPERLRVIDADIAEALTDANQRAIDVAEALTAAQRALDDECARRLRRVCQEAVEARRIGRRKVEARTEP